MYSSSLRPAGARRCALGASSRTFDQSTHSARSVRLRSAPARQKVTWSRWSGVFVFWQPIALSALQTAISHCSINSSTSHGSRRMPENHGRGLASSGTHTGFGSTIVKCPLMPLLGLSTAKSGSRLVASLKTSSAIGSSISMVIDVRMACPFHVRLNCV